MEYRRFSTFIEKVQYGYTADETSPIDGDAKYLRITDIVPYFVDKDRVPFCSITDKKKEQYLVNENDLLIARTGATTGYNLIVPKGYSNFIFASYLVRFFYNQESLYPLYLKHVLKSQQYYGFVNNYIGGSAQPGMNPKAFGRFQIPYVDYQKQKKIADILSTYDSLIELNTKRIKTLEQMAENLYKEWFVRFRFPGHEKAEFENGIPKGWEIKRLGDFGRVETGKTPSMEIKENYGDEYLFIKTPEMHGNTFVIDTEEKLSEQGHQSQRKKLLPPNSIMVSCIGSGGIVAINAEPAHTNQQINSIILDDLQYLGWLFFTCKSMKETIEMFGATGSTMTNLSKGKFERLKVTKPPKEIIAQYHEIANPLLEEIKHLTIINKKIIKQRDLLLPRLMNGKLEV